MKVFKANCYPPKEKLLSPLRTPGGDGGNAEVVSLDKAEVEAAIHRLMDVISADRQLALSRDLTAVWLEFWPMTVRQMATKVRVSFGGVCCRDCDVPANLLDLPGVDPT
jgi:hypothetical protein